jgi:hypothetical protein
MKKVVHLVIHDRKPFKNSNYRDFKRDGVVSILPVGTIPNNTKGFHMSHEDVLNLLYNLPEKYKGYDGIPRFVKNEKEVKSYTLHGKESVKPKEEVKKEEVVKTEPKEEIKELDLSILEKDYENMNEEELYNYTKELKDFAKENGINVAPNTKNIKLIHKKIREGNKE